MKFISILFSLFPILSSSYPKYLCPESLYDNVHAKNILNIIDMVHLNTISTDYKLLFQNNGLYQTIIKGYSNNNSELYISFQINDPSLFDEPKLVKCKLFENCIGDVHMKSQDTFLSLLSNNIIDIILKHQHIFIGSYHDNFDLFLSIYLHQKFSIIPKMSLSFGGIFIGDSTFTQHYVRLLKYENEIN